MARGKKKEEWTLEEKLEKALVPVEEQPYEVPENWCWVRLDHVSEIVMGQSPSGTDVTDDANYIPLIGGASDMGELYPTASRYTKVSTKLSKKDDIIVCIRATLGNPIYSDGEYCLGRGVAGIRTICCKKEYLRYFFKAFEQYLYDNATGTTFAQVTGKILSKMPVPLPPLQEQQRIIEQIESLFAKLDEAKEKVQFVQNSSDDNFVSVVHKALAGNLTQEWREQNGISKSTWKRDKLGNLGCLERGRSKHRPRNDSRLFGGSYPFIQTGDVAESDVFIEKHKRTLSEFGLAQSRMFPKGTLCITIAANIGDVAILSYDCCFPDSVVGFTPNEDVESKYIYYVMSELQKEIEANAPATAQKNINLKILNEIDIIIPSVMEQRQIIEIIDDMYNKKKQIERKAEQVADAIDMMKKSILAKAFRGELGTNNLEEESFVEQLKQILGGVE
mgnify:CR=1 FL=1